MGDQAGSRVRSNTHKAPRCQERKNDRQVTLSRDLVCMVAKDNNGGVSDAGSSGSGFKMGAGRPCTKHSSRLAPRSGPDARFDVPLRRPAAS